MEEASSIFKAIENAWNRAGQPHDFSVKVFEEPQRNFFGITVKSAKIGLFFDEKSLTKTAGKTTQPVSSKQKAEPYQKSAPQEKPAVSTVAPTSLKSSPAPSDRLKKVAQPQKSAKPAPVKKEAAPAKATQPSPTTRPTSTFANASDRTADKVESGESIWTPDMVKAAEDWVRTSLSLMKLGHITFSTKLSKYYIHFSFDAKLVESNAKEKTLFRSFAYLIMASLRNKFKKEFRGLKVVLSS